MKRIAVIGATGLLGAPVTTELIRAGFAVTILAKDEAPARAKFGEGPTYVAGDLRDPAALTRLLTNQDGLYMSLSVKPDSAESDYQPEREGIRAVLAVARQVGLPRIGYLAGLVQRYQGTDGFDWWVYELKNQALASIRQSGIPYFLYHASSFMDNFDRGSLKDGDSLKWAGESTQAMHHLAAADMGKQIANSFKLLTTESREYVMQGPEAFTMAQAAHEFIAHYPKQKLTFSNPPLALLKAGGVFSHALDYVAHLSESMNNYPEPFAAQPTWDELGRPTLTLAQYASQAE